jgi:hypothetical protein
MSNINVVQQIQLLHRNRSRYAQSIENLIAKYKKYPKDEMVKEYVDRETIK